MKKMKYCSVDDDSIIYIDGVRCSELEMKLDEGKREIRVRIIPTLEEQAKKVVLGYTRIFGFIMLGYTIAQIPRIYEVGRTVTEHVTQEEVKDLVGRGLERLADKISSYAGEIRPEPRVDPFTYRGESKGNDEYQYISHLGDTSDSIALTFNETPRFVCSEPVTAENVVFANGKPVGKTVLQKGEFVYVFAKLQSCYPEAVSFTPETSAKNSFYDLTLRSQ